MNYIVFDLEWNQSPGGKKYSNSRLPFEIIEIGAVKMNEQREVVDVFQRLVKPQVYNWIHDSIHEVIHVDYKDLADGVPFQQAVIDAGMGGILWVPYLVQRQVGGDDQRLPAAVSAVHDVVDLFQRVFGATFHAEIVNDKQGIAAELVHNIISSGKAAVQLVQDSGEVRHTHRHLLLHQSVRNAPGKETLACTHTAPEEQS